MKIVNFGSLNLDYVYTVDAIAAPGETIACADYQVLYGGKGLNQSIALARAGAEVVHVGCVGAEGAALKMYLRENGVDTAFVRAVSAPNGHAVIQVARDGQNSILVYGGANRAMTLPHMREALQCLQPGDMALLQNETNLTDEIARQSKEKGAKVVLNPSPIDPWLTAHFPFDIVDIFIVNESEGKALTHETSPAAIIAALGRQYPRAAFVLTLGEKGALYSDGTAYLSQAAFPARVVDTTAAGDTFTGYFLAELARGQAIAACLKTAAAASAVAVSVKGASQSIPLGTVVKIY